MTETAFVLHPDILAGKNATVSTDRSPATKLAEAVGLTAAINLSVVHTRIFQIKKIAPGTLFGSGQVEDIAHLAEEEKPDVIIVNHPLSPVQQRNLERAWKAKVIDRTGLIIEIFGDRAKTREGQIQVELAALNYQKGRLVRSWTHLERQRGGAGFMGGPGETQIEIDRRIISEKITRLKKDLASVEKNRNLQKAARDRVPFPIIALVGYTNAGKSTLFNAMTGASVMAEDLLFATLDPTMRAIRMPDGTRAILADTVGFISDLPTHLIAAFKSTLEQVRYADIILHVRDISEDNSDAERGDVIETLQSLGIEYESDPRIIEVWNKIDRLSPPDATEIRNRATFHDNIVPISAIKGNGIPVLLEKLQQKLSQGRVTATYILPGNIAGRAMAWLHQHGTVEQTDYIDDTTHVRTTMNRALHSQFQARFAVKTHIDN